ncbi:MAG: excinuclease ABC subunit UvrC [Chloroflexi bacterium]|nr:excinuclease ABC subunit UvrC [Chloroflexota bacterium]
MRKPQLDHSQIEKRLPTIPGRPGVYLFHGERGEVIYVGKAVNLRNRVRSYFRRSGQAGKVRRLVEHIADFEFILTDTELEALVLECNLIKRYRPKYNVRLRDDKHYPYLKVTFDEEWPRVLITRRIENDGGRYFGPYTDSRSVAMTLDLLQKIFPYRSCTQPITGNDARPCLNYHIRRCSGACVGAVSKEEYMEVMRQLCLFLEGRQDEIVKQMRRQMEEAAEKLQFERAAYLRDRIQAAEKITERQKIISTAIKDEDVIAFARSDGEACVQIFFVRGGKLVGREHFALEGTKDEDARHILSSFVMQFYDAAAYVPPRILLQNDIEEAAVIQSWLATKRGEKVAIQVPRKGEKRRLIDLVAENAAEVLEQMRARWLADEMKTGGAVLELAENLKLAGPPRRIECYDISNIRGTSAVGAMVVFESGQPKNSLYRRFKIKEVTTIDDYAMIREVLRRRFKRASSEQTESSDRSWQAMPDLVIIDGGKGHLSAALEVLSELGLQDAIPVVSLAKENEEIFDDVHGEPILLPRTSQGLYLVQRIRDEAHRFALSYHLKVRQKRSFGSALDEIPGLGPKRKAALLKRFGSTKGIREASVEDLASVETISKELARKIKLSL